MNLLLVDDERLARTELRRMLAGLPVPPDMQEAASAGEARDLLRSDRFDAILLDIEMPGESGFDLIESLGTSCPPVIFTTAYSEFAARAFDAGAVDYLLKPYGQERLRKALSRIVPSGSETFGEGDSLLLKIDGECQLVPVEAIEWIESLGRDGTLIRWDGSSGRARQTIGRLEAMLDPGMFFKASRDRIVNLKAIRRVDTDGEGLLTATMKGGDRLVFSRRQGALLRKQAVA